MMEHPDSVRSGPVEPVRFLDGEVRAAFDMFGQGAGMLVLQAEQGRLFLGWEVDFPGASESSSFLEAEEEEEVWSAVSVVFKPTSPPQFLDVDDKKTCSSTTKVT